MIWQTTQKNGVRIKMVMVRNTKYCMGDFASSIYNLRAVYRYI